ncbi:orotidine-5'-phosphate decarboxylase [Desulforamulus hydrothermalis]|uniref:Orotidine 5'-phosphate decarboxylase n=1 Tax=Desulforamulus hydrothermalis Lam5 = DSM 18033 TaxID=1121428 RepID=K8DXC3_9FIRM|nr:orotidine-5'-phosphate decarboxylase [Desulforamulus hydrothermalis]CCO07204.1 Orotidine 5'-phosphate decarboxylase [Desulforamulus hydrothermalis Lam5 = DSM 18033]SHG87945.1 orotidine-5'-phosphate decarboxylase [Desulforamulus hydrothermalis Lam5 = DSM 18033]
MENKLKLAKEKLIVALDVDTGEAALDLVKKLSTQVGMFKVGMQLFYQAGPDIVKRLKEAGVRVFLDLKLHDIPNTVAQAARGLTALGADIINVHAAGGTAMMRAAAEAVREQAAALGRPAPRVIAVTVLTSIDPTAFQYELGFTCDIQRKVADWALLTRQAGLDGVVASPREIAVIRRACGEDFLIITPGIRPAWSVAGDQKRIMTPAAALGQGAGYLVVGRPITGQADPAAAAQKIITELAEVL